MYDYFEIEVSDECPACEDEIRSAQYLGEIDECGIEGRLFKCQWCDATLLDRTSLQRI